MRDMQESEDGRFTAEEDSGGAAKRAGSYGFCRCRCKGRRQDCCKSDTVEWSGHDRWIGGHERTQVLRRACMADANAGTARPISHA
jgi:hypothetical protein